MQRPEGRLRQGLVYTPIAAMSISWHLAAKVSGPAQAVIPRKVIKFGEDVCNNILYPIPRRQFVFSIPVLLRVYFKYDRGLLTDFCHCAGVSPDKKLIESHNPQVNFVEFMGKK